MKGFAFDHNGAVLHFPCALQTLRSVEGMAGGPRSVEQCQLSQTPASLHYSFAETFADIFLHVCLFFFPEVCSRVQHPFMRCNGLFTPGPFSVYRSRKAFLPPKCRAACAVQPPCPCSCYIASAAKHAAPLFPLPSSQLNLFV